MVVVDFRVDRCEALSFWLPEFGCGELASRASRVRVSLWTSDVIAKTASPDMRVVADGDVVVAKGEIPEWEPALHGGDAVVLSGVAELPGVAASALGASWSLSGPPVALRAWLDVEKGRHRVAFELETRSEADARRVTDVVRDLVKEDVVLQTAGIGDFAPLVRTVETSHRGAVARATLAIGDDEAFAVLARIKVLGWQPLPTGRGQALWIYIHADGTVSTAGRFAALERLPELLGRVPKEVEGILLEYPPGTLHGTITDVVATVRRADRNAWVSPVPLPAPRFPALVSFDARIAGSLSTKAKALVHACGGGDATACWDLGALLESEPSTGDPRRAYAHGCRLGHRDACKRAGETSP